MNKYCFKDILEKEITIVNEKQEKITLVLSRIEIPKIQRDYAQGRPQESEIRKRFLDNIFETLHSPSEKNMEMDFVYGAVDEQTKVFTPLDGQQRLTTLFLLYWYIGTRECARQELVSLQKFTYETRASSRRFCEELIKSGITIEDKPSKEITNLSWFHKSDKQDPTIKSMLHMLDAIHEKYGSGKQDLFARLSRLQFYILALNGFNLTDELYVNMNARGKQLTDFENFKADLIKWMKDEKNSEKDFFNKEVDFGNRKMPYYLSFSQKLDTTWTDYFWQDIKNDDVDKKDREGNLIYPDGKIIDPLFMSLYYRFFLNQFILKSSMSNEALEKYPDYQTLYKEAKYQNFDVFEEIATQNTISKFETFMETLQSYKTEILNCIQPSWQDKEKFSFYAKEISQPERVVFLGIMLFLEKKEKFDNVKFKQWMRVVLNIVENTDIDGHLPMIGAMKLIAEVSEKSKNSKDIYEYLSTDNTEPASSKNAVLEERQKAKFINAENSNEKDSWEEIFINAEKHPFFRGSVGFIITDEMKKDEFIHRTEMAFSVFDSKGITEKYRENGHIFLRALISRYTDSQVIGKNYTDIDEKEHYLKKMLASDTTVKNATTEWFSLGDEQELMNALNDSVKKDSEIPGWGKNDDGEKIRIRRAHEALYKTPDLQKWMQENKAIRFAWYGDGHLYISKPYSRSLWIMLDNISRDDIVTHLLETKKMFSTDNIVVEDSCGKPCFFSGSTIEVTGKIADYDVRFFFYENSYENSKLSVFAKSAEDVWDEKPLKTYNYADEKDLVEKLDSEIFNIESLKQLLVSPHQVKSE